MCIWQLVSLSQCELSFLLVRPLAKQTTARVATVTRRTASRFKKAKHAQKTRHRADPLFARCWYQLHQLIQCK